MSSFIQSLWLSNIELSLLLIAVLIARLAIKKTARVYNSYLLWLSIPIGLMAASLAAKIEFTEAPIISVNVAVNSYILEPQNTFNSWTLIGTLWACVAFLLLGRLVRQHWLLRKKLKCISEPTVIAVVSRYPIIGISEADFSPAVYGFLTPKIYFPNLLAKELDKQQIELIIRHEEQHIKQQHLWLNLLWDIAVCIFWFNPLLYISRQGFRHDQELYCDYLVLNDSTQHDYQSYGHALLSTVSATHSVSLLCSWKAFNQLEERIMNIKQSTTFGTKFVTKLLLSICSVIIVTASSIYAVSASDYSTNSKLHSSIEDDGDAKYIMDIGNKRYVEENGQRYVLEGQKGVGKKRAITTQEDADFTELLEQSKKGWDKDSLTHSIRDGDEEIIWRTGNISYIEKNGKRFVEENDTTRPMTKKEQKAFSNAIKQGQKDEVEYRKALKRAKAKQKKDLSHRDKNPKLSEKLVFTQLEQELERAYSQITIAQTEIKSAQTKGDLSNDVASSILETLNEKKQELSQQKHNLEEYFAHDQDS